MPAKLGLRKIIVLALLTTPKIGIQTETREKVPPAVGIVLLAGAVALILGSRKT
jgi:hypothetical protein